MSDWAIQSCGSLMRDELAIQPGEPIWFRLQGGQLFIIASTGDSFGRIFCRSVSAIRNMLVQGDLTEAKVENAITRFEDLIIPVIRSLPAATELKVSGLELTKVMSLLPESGDDVVSIESVEELFNRLADHAAGSPVAWRHDLSPARVAPGLIALREAMHHGGFRHVSLLREDVPDPACSFQGKQPG